MNFWTVYEKHLTALYKADVYPWPLDYAPTLAARMREVWTRGSGSKDGPAFKSTCKELGIKHTYKAINAYLEANP